MIELIGRLDLARAWPWAEALRDILASVGPARLPGAHLLVGSDYSGDHTASEYRVYSFVLVDADASPAWPAARAHVRSNFLADGRRMSFKRLGDRQRLAALRPFLDAADLLFGVSVAFVVRKRLHRISTTGKTLDVWRDLHGVQARWNSESFEAMVRVVHLFTILLGRWSKPGMHVSWVTDQDLIAANEARLDDLLALAGRIVGLYVNHGLGELAVNTTGIDDSTRGFEDFVAIADLVAGSLSETVAEWSKQPGWHGETGLLLLPEALSEKTNVITRWFWGRSSNLVRVAVLVDCMPDGRKYVSHMDITVGL